MIDLIILCALAFCVNNYKFLFKEVLNYIASNIIQAISKKKLLDH